MRLPLIEVLASCDVEMGPEQAQMLVRAGKWWFATCLEPVTRKVGDHLVLIGYTAQARGQRASGGGEFIWISAYGLVARSGERTREACEEKLGQALEVVHFLPDTPHPVSVCKVCAGSSRLLLETRSRFDRVGWQCEMGLMEHGKENAAGLPLAASLEKWNRLVWSVQPTACTL